MICIDHYTRLPGGEPIFLKLKCLIMLHLSEIREIENKHVQRLTGKAQRTCSRIISNIRAKLGKLPGQKLTIAEYARCMGLCPIAVCSFLGIVK